jgi:hypothetical protein
MNIITSNKTLIVSLFCPSKSILQKPVNVCSRAIMKFHDRNRHCHPERSEGSWCWVNQILRCAQDDIAGFGRETSLSRLVEILSHAQNMIDRGMPPPL